MAEPKKRSAPHQGETTKANGGNPPLEPLTGHLSRETLESLSTLQFIDLIATRLPPRHLSVQDLFYLRDRIADLEETHAQAQEALIQLDAIVEKLRAPAFRVGTFLMPVDPDLAHVCLAGSDYVCRIDPGIPTGALQVGQRVLCNEAFAIVQSLGYEKNGPIVRVDELLSEGRLRIGQETGLAPLILVRSALLAKEKIKPGMEVRLDGNQRVALEVVGNGKRIDRSLETVTELPWESIGGQDQAVQAIRDTIELPFVHRALYQRFDHSIPKGFLLYGPPGCGKTMLGKATAYNLRQQVRRHTRIDREEFFLHIQGPEILNMWVGESERQVRDLFAQCREQAAEGALAFLFIDEAESILSTRRAGRYQSVLSTLVPMFCTEMDGLEPLQNVVVILASNRADLIDPAILRPGRIDRKIKVHRPDRDGVRRIFEIYLRDQLPLAESSAALAQAATDALFARTDENQFLEVLYRSGRREVLHRGDLVSGAIVAAIVERAKSLAIRRSIQTSAETDITREDLIQAFEMEYAENDLFPTGDITEDWLKLTDLDPDNVIRLGPIRNPARNHPGRRII
ncbi:MAG: AAA family ATPase [Verrucomicrobia bacterium]|nr:AAA family ATPase [Verrucomicrobiota bacterium]